MVAEATVKIEGKVGRADFFGVTMAANKTCRRKHDYDAILARLNAGATRHAVAVEFKTSHGAIEYICKTLGWKAKPIVDHAAILAKIAEGKKTTQIAAETGVSKSSVKRVAQDNQKSIGRPLKWTKEREAQLLSLIPSKLTCAEIGKELGGFSGDSVWNRIKLLTGKGRPFARPDHWKPKTGPRKVDRPAPVAVAVPVGANHTVVPANWTGEQFSEAFRMWHAGQSTPQIRDRVGKSVGAIVGVAHRNGWADRPLPTGLSGTLKHASAPRKARAVVLAPVRAAPEPRVPTPPPARAALPVTEFIPSGRVCSAVIGEGRQARYCEAPIGADQPRRVSYCAEHAAIYFAKVA